MVFDNLSEKGWAHFAPHLTCKTAKSCGKTVENRDAQIVESPLFPVATGLRVF